MLKMPTTPDQTQVRNKSRIFFAIYDSFQILQRKDRGQVAGFRVLRLIDFVLSKLSLITHPDTFPVSSWFKSMN